MIVVIADDFTGAAEIAGIGLRYGLTVEVNLHEPKTNPCDLQVIALNTRSLPVSEARRVIAAVTKKLESLKPNLFFKKVDSVLRGHVVAELEEQMIASKVDNALIVAGNPDLGRVISGGQYYIDGEPLHNTYFAHDPLFPAFTSDVKALMSRNRSFFGVVNQRSNEVLPVGNIVIGDVEHEVDFVSWAIKVMDDNRLLAGSSGMFHALLLERGMIPLGSASSGWGAKHLVIEGTTFRRSPEEAQSIYSGEYQVLNMPEAIYKNEDEDGKSRAAWIADAKKMLSQGSLMLTMMHDGSQEEGLSARLEREIAAVVKKLAEQETFDELFVAGGSTLASILNTLEIDHLSPVTEFATGVIRMSLPDKWSFHLTCKPGSYAWPQEMFNLKSTKNEHSPR